MEATEWEPSPSSAALLLGLERTKAIQKVMDICNRWEGTISYPEIAVLLTC